MQRILPIVLFTLAACDGPPTAITTLDCDAEQLVVTTSDDRGRVETAVCRELPAACPGLTSEDLLAEACIEALCGANNLGASLSEWSNDAGDFLSFECI